MTDRVLKSSDTEFGTPTEFFNKVHQLINFKQDVCAVDWNKKLDNYISPEEDSLVQTWESPAWCNPPYGKDLHLWISKACQEADNDRSKIIALLIPANKTETKYFKKIWARASMIVFIEGRIKFDGGKEYARWPSMLVFLGPYLGEEIADKLSELGQVISYYGIHNQLER